jgi:hypothetical protein
MKASAIISIVNMAGSVLDCRLWRFLSCGYLAAALVTSACQIIPPQEETISGPEHEAAAVRVRSIPSGAVIVLDGREYEERTPATLSPVAPGEHSIAISLPGYWEWKKRFLLEKGQTVNLDVLLVPAATGSLSISSVPFQSIIFIDGRPTPYLTPATIDNLSLGTHTVLLRRDGYEDWSQAIVVVENRRLQLNASLKPAKGLRGNLNIQTSPSRADIFLDGYPTGNSSPTTLFSLLAGSHTIQLRKEGYATWSDEVTVWEEKTSNLLVTMKPIEQKLSGSAEIDSTPAGATVYLDGVRLRQDTPLTLESVATGTHAVRMERQGFLDWEGELLVLPGERTVLAVTLDYRYWGMVNLLVKSTPPGAAVTVDGTPSGRKTPVTFDDLSPGEHHIVLEKEGYKNWSAPVRVSSNKVAVLEADLVAEGSGLDLSLRDTGPDFLEFEAKLLSSRTEGKRSGTFFFSVSPPYFGQFSPAEIHFENGRGRTTLAIRSPLEEARVIIRSGKQRESFRLKKGPAGWELEAGDGQ